MNWAHAHLILNHVPVLGAVFGCALLAWGFWRRDLSVQRAALATFVLAAVVAIPVYLTGEPAEDVVERVAGSADRAIEAHEAAAGVSLVGIELLGAIAVAAVLLRRIPRAAAAFTRGALVAAIVTAGLMAWTANLGGRIRHVELTGAVAPHQEDHRGEGL